MLAQGVSKLVRRRILVLGTLVVVMFAAQRWLWERRLVGAALLAGEGR